MVGLEQVIFKRNGQEKKSKPENINISEPHCSKMDTMEESVPTSKTMEHVFVINNCTNVDTTEMSNVTQL